VSPTHQDLSNDTTFSQIKSCVPVPLKFHSQQQIEMNAEKVSKQMPKNDIRR
jgi:hypothetical protein